MFWKKIDHLKKLPKIFFVVEKKEKIFVVEKKNALIDWITSSRLALQYIPISLIHGRFRFFQTITPNYWLKQELNENLNEVATKFLKFQATLYVTPSGLQAGG